MSKPNIMSFVATAEGEPIKVSAVTARPFKGDTGTVRLKILDGWVTLTYTGELHIDLTRDFCVGGVESSDSSIYCESSWIE